MEENEMKKLINVTLAMMLVLSSSVVAFATEPNESNQVPSTGAVISQVAENTDVVTDEKSISNQDDTKTNKVVKNALLKESKQPKVKLSEAEKTQLQLLQQERLQLKGQINTLKLEIISIKLNKDIQFSEEVKLSIQDNIKGLKAINVEIQALHNDLKGTRASLKEARKVNDAEATTALIQQIISVETKINAKISDKIDTLQILVNLFHTIDQ